MTVEEASPPPVEVDVFQDCWQAVALFSKLLTQWRVGVAGRVGLDYNVMFRFMDRMTLTHDEFDQLVEDIGTMEAAVLDWPDKA